MKYVVAVSIEVETDNEETAAQLGYTFLNERVATELVVSNSKGQVKRIKLDPELAKGMRSLGRAAGDDQDEWADE